MKRTNKIMTVIFTAFLMMPVLSSAAQTNVKAPLPQVPIIYPGDTDSTIMRRAKWVEGAKKEGVVVLWSNLSPSDAKKITDQFSKVYPFITVEASRSSSEEKAAQLEAEFSAGKVSVDIMDGGGRVNTARWRKIGLIGKFTDIIPGINKIPKALYSQYGDWAMPGNNAALPMYNTSLISPAEAPKNWEDLLNPKWKGRLAMITDMKFWAIFALSEKGWGIQKTENFLKKLKGQNIIWASGPTQANTMLSAGEYPILVAGLLYHCLRAQDEGAPTEWVRASPVPITGQAYTMIQKAPHPNAARLFLEWQFSPVGLKAFEEVTQRGAIFPGAGTRQAKLLEKAVLMPRTEQIEEKWEQMGLVEKYAGILGVKSF